VKIRLLVLSLLAFNSGLLSSPEVLAATSHKHHVAHAAHAASSVHSGHKHAAHGLHAVHSRVLHGRHARHVRALHSSRAVRASRVHHVAHAAPLSSSSGVRIASGSAMIVDLQTHDVIYSREPDQVRPIASLTKLMTAMVTLDAGQPLDEVISVNIRHTKEMQGVFSRVKLNSEITRRQMLQLALMSSENRAAASLAEHYPGGYPAFINAMNAKAKELGMESTHYVEPTGLSYHNVSTARDLSRLLVASREYPLIGQLSTTAEKTAFFSHPNYSLPFRNTNHLIMDPNWSIQLTKTGYTDVAGHCLVMRTVINNRPVALVVLDAFGKYTSFADANRLRTWIESGKASKLAGVNKTLDQQGEGG
jgi:D-alanyl-D-alanine endopeptidase (penicillin-binding protein 7)